MEFNIYAHAKKDFSDDIEGGGEVKIKRTMFDYFDVFKIYGINTKGASFEVNIFLNTGQDIEQAVYDATQDLNVKIENHNAIDGKAKEIDDD